MPDHVPPAPPAPGAALLHLIHGYGVTQLIYVAAKLSLADRLSLQPQTSRELAAVVRVDPAALHRVLRGLAHSGVFAELADGRFTLTPLGERLQSHHPGSLRGLAIIHGELFYPAWGQLLHRVQTGETGFDRVFQTDFFTYLAQHPEAENIFNDFITRIAGQNSTALLAVYDFAAAHQVVDIGGGQGTLLGPILEAHPHLRGIVLDKPSVIEGTTLFLDVAGLADRCAAVAGDFLQAVPAGGDLYILAQILHDWDDARAELILTNCRQSMADTGTLLIIERLLPEHITQPSPPVEFDLNLLAIVPGRERTATDYRGMLAATGFQLRRVLPLPTGMFLLEAAAVAARAPDSAPPPTGR